jgi:polyferredoxin/Na+-translocating ferredoxin:NAD+ oxidoreductase RNF subunit RnfB
MKLRHLKPARVAISLFIFVFLLLFFLNIHNSFMDSVSMVFLRLQLFPSILRFLALAFSIAGLGFALVIVLTLLFGRVYCSSICPLGTLQDFFIHISGRLKKKSKARFHYDPSKKRIFRYALLAVVLIFWFSGSLFLLNLLDPFSNFGKISVTLIQPVFRWLNNGFAFMLQRADIYAVTPILPQSLPGNVILVSAIILLTILVMSVMKGRFFCNTLCPAGSVLSLLSAKSFYRIDFVHESCNMCRKCEFVCKAECIDSKSKMVDHARCVSCFNCLSACKNQGLTFRNFLAGKSANILEPEPVAIHKRNFLLTVAGGMLSLPLFRNKTFAQAESKPGMIPVETELPVTPPGSISYDHFTNNCIACYLCVGACPTNVLVPSFFDYGLQGFMQPKLDYHKSYCNFDCTRCSEVCPTGAIAPIDTETKKIEQVGIAKFMYESCIVTVERTDCGACSEHCPTKAVSMIPYHGLWLPEVEPDLCIGCGACEFACPTKPYKAIYVESNRVHQKANPIEEDEGPREHDVDEFPF